EPPGREVEGAERGGAAAAALQRIDAPVRRGAGHGEAGIAALRAVDKRPLAVLAKAIELGLGVVLALGVLAVEADRKARRTLGVQREGAVLARRAGHGGPAPGAGVEPDHLRIDHGAGT